MPGHPDALSLLDAVRSFLTNAESSLSAQQAFHAKVAGNVLGIVMRELEQQPDKAEEQAFAPWGGASAICRGLRDGHLSTDDASLLDALEVAVIARLAVDNPRYSTFARLKEKSGGRA